MRDERASPMIQHAKIIRSRQQESDERREILATLRYVKFADVCTEHFGERGTMMIADLRARRLSKPESDQDNTQHICSPS